MNSSAHRQWHRKVTRLHEIFVAACGLFSKREPYSPRALSARVGLLALILIGADLPTTASASCVEDGGIEFCRAPLVSDWSVGWCPEMGDTAPVERAQCMATGGHFNGVYADFPCTGGGPVTEPNLASVVTTFEQVFYDTTSCGIATDSGWGQSTYSSLCALSPATISCDTA